MSTARLYKWTQISGWEIGAALRQGQLRVLCAHPNCRRVSVFGANLAHDQVWLWVLAKRMRCKTCGHLGAEFEIWSTLAGGAGAGAPPPPKWRDDRKPHGRR